MTKAGLLGFIAIIFFVFSGNAAGETKTLLTGNRNLPEKCSLIPDRGPCKGLFWKYYYNAKTKKCEEFVYGGCNGVVPFETKEECESLCKNKKE